MNQNTNEPAPYTEMATRQLPTGWAPGPSLFKDWCSRWFGPDADDAYLLKAAQDLATTVLGMVAVPGAPSGGPPDPMVLVDGRDESPSAVRAVRDNPATALHLLRRLQARADAA